MPDGSLKSSVVVVVTNMSTSQKLDLALGKAVTAHADRWAEHEDVDVAVFDVRQAYFCAEEKRGTFVELPDFVPAEFRATHVEKSCARRCTEPVQLQHHGEMS